MSPADELRRRPDAVPVAPLMERCEHANGGPRIGEVGRADLHCTGSGEHQFDRIPPVGDSPDADNDQGSVHVEDGPDCDRMDRATAVSTPDGAQHRPARLRIDDSR
jgi:hypothetical protein